MNTLQHNSASPSPTTQLTREQIDLIKSICAKNASDDEFKLFIHLAKNYGLDPLKREIWFVKYGSKEPSIFVSRDGLLTIAHRSGVFDGMNSYTIDDQNGKPIKAVCEVYRKDMKRPFRAEVKFSEYNNPNSPTWRQYPSAMLIKVAESFALRRAFNINGMVSESEMSISQEPSQRAQEGNPHDDVAKHVAQFLPMHTVFSGARIRAVLNEMVAEESLRNQVGKALLKEHLLRLYRVNENGEQVLLDAYMHREPSKRPSEYINVEPENGLIQEFVIKELVEEESSEIDDNNE